MSGRNCSKVRSQDQMRRQGIDDCKDQSVPRGLSGPPRKRKSKAELRAEAEAAVAEWKRRQEQPS